MLRNLAIRDMLLIDRLELQFQPGLNVLTGETGAGKSILLDSLGFVLGWRGRAELVRAGAAQGEVEAVFDLPQDHPGRAVLTEAGIDAGDELILRRINTPDGRKTAWINDRRTSGEVLRTLSETLIELHGQHDDRGLLNARGHRQLLDAFAGAEPALSRTRAAWRGLQAARAARRDAAEKLATLRAEEDFLRHAVAELDKLDPQPGEEAELDTRRRLMQAAERLRGDVDRARQALGEDGAERLILDGIRWLEGAAEGVEGRLDGAIGALGRALTELGEAQAEVDGCIDALDLDPMALETVEDRLFALRALARKHAVLPDDLGAHAETLRERLSVLDASDSQSAILARDEVEAEGAFRNEAEALRAELSQAFESQAAELAAAQSRIAELEAGAEQSAQELADVRASLAQVQEQAHTAEARAVEIERRAGELRAELDRAHTEADRLRADAIDQKQHAQALAGELATVKARAEATEQAHQEQRKTAAEEAQRTAERMAKAEADREEARRDAAKAREEAARLAGKLDALTEQNAALLAAMKATEAPQASTEAAPAKPARTPRKPAE